MTTVSEFAVGDSVSFPAIGRRYAGSFVGTVEKVGRKNLTVRYTKGSGAHLFIATLDPTEVEVEKVGASRSTAETVRHYRNTQSGDTAEATFSPVDDLAFLAAPGFAGMVAGDQVDVILDTRLGWVLSSC